MNENKRRKEEKKKRKKIEKCVKGLFKKIQKKWYQ